MSSTRDNDIVGRFASLPLLTMDPTATSSWAILFNAAISTVYKLVGTWSEQAHKPRDEEGAPDEEEAILREVGRDGSRSFRAAEPSKEGMVIVNIILSKLKPDLLEQVYAHPQFDVARGGGLVHGVLNIIGSIIAKHALRKEVAWKHVARSLLEENQGDQPWSEYRAKSRMACSRFVGTMRIFTLGTLTSDHFFNPVKLDKLPASTQREMQHSLLQGMAPKFKFAVRMVRAQAGWRDLTWTQTAELLDEHVDYDDQSLGLTEEEVNMAAVKKKNRGGEGGGPTKKQKPEKVASAKTLKKDARAGKRLKAAPSGEDAKEDGASAARVKCYKCGEFGHTIGSCTNPTLCYNCAGKGHISKDCKQPRKTKGSG
jgi:hypothetical protein